MANLMCSPDRIRSLFKERMGSNVTMVITACGRNELLRDTLDSFIRVNCGGAKPDRTIILEDGMAEMPEWLKENVHYYSANVGTVEYVRNEARMGQVYSIDRAYSLVKTDYIFHCEEDWMFQQGGNFLQTSKEILEKYPEIIQVSLRGDTGWHQLIDLPPYPFKIAMPYWKGGWGGISWNPGLRRVSDYQRLGSYGKHLSYSSTGLASEQSLSRTLLDMGYRIADMGQPIVVHTGGNQSRSAGYAPTMPKILIAILACHQFKYSKWESGDSPAFDKGIAYNGEAYGTGIHISGENNRIEALRETWLQDVDQFRDHVHYKLFYGAPHDRQAAPDEVFLSCGDTYGDLPAKTIEICKYALAHDYGYVFKCDDDSLIYVDRILQEVMGAHADYAGYLNGRVATGGTGYWLSKRAFQIIAEKASANNHWAEDVSVSKCLFHHNIQPVHLAGHRTGRADHWFWPDGKFDPLTLPADASAIHAVQPEVMRQWYAHKENLA